MSGDDLNLGFLSIPQDGWAQENEDTATKSTRASSISDFVNKEIAVDFDALPFEQVLTRLRAASGITIHVDWPSLAEIKVTAADPVTLKLQKSTSADALRLALEQLGSESSRPVGGVLADHIVVTSGKVVGDRDRLQKWESDMMAKLAAATAAPSSASASAGTGQGVVAAPAKPRGFTAAELNLLSARLDGMLFIMGLDALAAKDEASAQTKAVDAARPPAAPSTAPSGAAAPAAVPTGAEALGAQIREPLRVIARFTNVNEALEHTLTSLGIEIEARARPANVLVLRVPREKLIDLALLDGVRRIVPWPAEVVAAP